MHPNSFPISTLLALCFSLFALLNSQTILCGDDPRYSTCSTTISCGSIANIGYPFWGINRASYCGLPVFELKCEDEVAKLNMIQNTLRVLDVNTEQQSLKVARDDYWNGYCPSKLVNTTIDFTHFHYGPSDLRNLTLFYGCQLPSIAIFLTNCTIDGDLTGVWYATIILQSDPRLVLCHGSVIVPIYETAAQDLEANPSTVNDALKKGFELQWQVDSDQCRNCVDSDGVCGYNQTTNSFICFCRNQTSETVCTLTQGTLNFLPL